MSDTRQAEDSVVLTALYSRITIGKLVEPAPSSTEVQAMLQAAARAPDHGRLKPWRFFIVRGAALERLGEVMAEALKRRDPNCTEDQLERERQKPPRAPMVLVVAAQVRQDSSIPAIEQILAVGAATQNLLLAAAAMDNGSAWKTGAAAYDSHLKAAFGLNPSDAIVGFVYLGKCGRQPPAPTLPDLSDILVDWQAVSAFAKTGQSS